MKNSRKFYKIEKFIILGTLPYLFLIHNITEASIVALGLIMGIVLSLMIRKILNFLPSISRSMIFIVIYTSLIYIYISTFSIYFKINNSYLFLIIANGMAFLILEPEGDGINIFQIMAGSSISTIFLFIFGAVKSFNFWLSTSDKFKELAPFKLNMLFHQSLYPLYVALFLIIMSRFTKEFRK